MVKKLPEPTKIISRAEALEKGLKYYFTGKSCKYGHIYKRKTSSGECYRCNLDNKIAFSKTLDGKKYARKVKKKLRDAGYFETPEFKKQETINKKKYYYSEKGTKTRKNHYENVFKEFMKTDDWREKKRKSMRKERENPITRFLYNYRTRIALILKKTNTVKNQTTMNLLGCDTNFFIKYLEKLFEKNMTMKNYGEWHLDHIVPLNYFVKNYDMNDKHTIQIAFHYSNLQPMWAKENISKKDKILKKVAEKKIAEIKKLIKN